MNENVKVGDVVEVVRAAVGRFPVGLRGTVIPRLPSDNVEGVRVSWIDGDWHQTFLYPHEYKIVTEEPKTMDNKDSEQSLRDAYLTMQAACGIEVGDTVRVLRKAKDYEMGWGNVWPFTPIGESFQVDRIGTAGIGSADSGLSYPFFVLELVEKAPKDVTVVISGDRSVRLVKSEGRVHMSGESRSFVQVKAIWDSVLVAGLDSVKIGCQMFTREDVQQVVEAINRLS